MYLTFPTQDIMRPQRSKIHWPHQERPLCKTSFQHWARCLRVCFLQGRNTTLNRSLGKWLVHAGPSESVWPVYIHKSYQSLVVVKEDSIELYSTVHRVTACTTYFDTQQYVTIPTILNDYIPADMTSNDRSIIATHSKQRIFTTEETPSLVPHDIVASIQNDLVCKTHLLQHFHIPDHILFMSTLQNAAITFFVVSDGGLYAGKGSFGVAFGTGGEDLGNIEGPAPGNSIHMTSLRSEAYGVLAALAFLNLYVKSYNIAIPDKRKLHLYSDNLGLIRWLEEILAKACYSRMYLRAEADVILQIEKEINDVKNSNFELHVEHVKGHQDDVMPYNTLPREAQLNVQADSSATNYLRQGLNHTYEELQDNPVSLYICDALITRDFKRQIRSASRSPELQKYLIIKYKWQQTTPDLIWWHIHGKAISSLPKEDQRRI